MKSQQNKCPDAAEPATAAAATRKQGSSALQRRADASARVQQLQTQGQRMQVNAGVLQRRVINAGPHGTVDTGPLDFASGLTEDVPDYKHGTAPLGSGDTVGGTMDVLLTPGHGQGSSPRAQNDLFERLPTLGNYKLPANSTQPKDGSTLYIKGHLLNDNLGGPGTGENLYPITHDANMDHERLVESPIKDWVNNRGGIVRYRVKALFQSQGNTDVVGQDGRKLKQVNANFDISVWPLTSGSVTAEQRAVIGSRWNAGTSNSGSINLSGTPMVASNFQAGLVKLAPRAESKKEFDEAYVAATKELAGTQGMVAWLKKQVRGIGEAGGNALLELGHYQEMTKTKKRVLSTAYNILKKYIDSHQADLLAKHQAMADGVADVDADTPLADPDVEASAKIVAALPDALVQLSEVENEIEELLLSFGRLSLGPPEVSDAQSTTSSSPAFPFWSSGGMQPVSSGGYRTSPSSGGFALAPSSFTFPPQNLTHSLNASSFGATPSVPSTASPPVTSTHGSSAFNISSPVFGQSSWSTSPQQQAVVLPQSGGLFNVPSGFQGFGGVTGPGFVGQGNTAPTGVPAFGTSPLGASTPSTFSGSAFTTHRDPRASNSSSTQVPDVVMEDDEP